MVSHTACFSGLEEIDDKQTESLFKRPGYGYGFHFSDWKIQPYAGSNSGISEALEARELIKITLLKNCLDDIHVVAATLAERTRSEVVQVIRPQDCII